MVRDTSSLYCSSLFCFRGGGAGGFGLAMGLGGARVLTVGVSFFSSVDGSSDSAANLFWVILPITIVPVVNNNMFPGVRRVLFEPRVEFNHAV